MENSNIIFSYTRKEAIEDGMQALVDGEGAELAKELGYKVPIYFTCGVWGLVSEACNDRDSASEYKGVMWDIFFMSRTYFKMIDESSLIFEVSINGKAHKILVRCGATDIDDPAPCLTFMLPYED